MIRPSTAEGTRPGNKVGWSLEELHRHENQLVTALLALADRHKVEHEIYHVAQDIASWSQEHVRRIATVAEDYGLDLDPEPQGEAQLLGELREKESESTGRLQAPGLLLLADLRDIYQMAAGLSLDWQVLTQTAQAMKDGELLALAQDCHPETLRQMTWANANAKTRAAQVMVTG